MDDQIPIFSYNEIIKKNVSWIYLKDLRKVGENI